LICGYGPGISAAVARRFGAAGYSLALVARSEDKLAAGVASLAESGVKAAAFPADLGDPEAVEAMVTAAREQLGPIHAIHWNAYAGLAGDLLECSPAELRTVFDVGVVGAVAAVQAALPDLRAAEDGAVLITGGGFAFYADEVDQAIVNWKCMGLGLAKAAQHKLTSLLHHELASEGIYVGSVVVTGVVKGTAFDSGGGSVEPKQVAEKFWQLFEGRDQVTTTAP
jgi:NADP-dependent 3-hydroxy acid dehydrogenase YdfG